MCSRRSGWAALNRCARTQPHKSPLLDHARPSDANRSTPIRPQTPLTARNAHRVRARGGAGPRKNVPNVMKTTCSTARPARTPRAASAGSAPRGRFLPSIVTPPARAGTARREARRTLRTHARDGQERKADSPAAAPPPHPRSPGGRVCHAAAIVCRPYSGARDGGESSAVEARGALSDKVTSDVPIARQTASLARLNSAGCIRQGCGSACCYGGTTADHSTR